MPHSASGDKASERFLRTREVAERLDLADHARNEQVGKSFNMAFALTKLARQPLVGSPSSIRR